MLEVRIETGIPLPGKISKTASKLCYKDIPFDSMNVGDSFTLPADIGGKVGSAIGSYRCSSKENIKKQFVTRTENGQTRVWRTK